MTDYNTQMMNSRQADEDKAESLDDAIDARVAELLMPGEECDPLDGLNICEALNESTSSEKMVLGKVLAERKFDQAGILVEWLTKSYWGKKAEELAVRELT